MWVRMHNFLIGQSCHCSSNLHCRPFLEGAAKSSIVLGIALEVFALIAYSANWISKDHAIIGIVSGGLLAGIASVAFIIFSFIDRNYNNEKEVQPVLKIKSKDEYILPKQQVFVLEDFVVNCSEKTVQRIYNQYRNELKDLNSQNDTDLKVLYGGQMKTVGNFKDFLETIHLFKNSLDFPFLEEEIQLSSRIIGGYRECHYKPDLMPILPIVYSHCLLPYKHNPEALSSFILSSNNRKKLVQDIVEWSCQIKLCPKVIDFFFDQSNLGCISSSKINI